MIVDGRSRVLNQERTTWMVAVFLLLGVLVPTGILPHEQGGGGGSGMVHHAPTLRTGDLMPETAALRITRAASAMDEVAR